MNLPCPAMSTSDLLPTSIDSIKNFPKDQEKLKIIRDGDKVRVVTREYFWLFGNYRANDTYREVAPSHN